MPPRVLAIYDCSVRGRGEILYEVEQNTASAYEEVKDELIYLSSAKPLADV